ncbi:MAG: sigma-54-dependent Fis family transcriptional regulator [Lentisphaerae bacterium]|nr:sigma-54-dependent Fis family transcriptional regulator [Lentisphaerota bacterium]
MGKHRILLVDDERGTLDAMQRFLKRRFEVTAADNGAAAIDFIQKNDYDLVLTDLRMPGRDGMGVLDAALQKNPQPLCIILSAYGTVESAVNAVKRGAFDFVMKPVNLEQLTLIIDRALATRQLQCENRELRQKLSQDQNNAPVVAQSAQMRSILELIKQVAPSRTTVLLTGESGTGKEVMAKALHDWSNRTGKFVPVHCAALPATLLESELFGHEKGAFTGATEERKGRFELAAGGTLFLDEIGEIDLATQVKLLRVLENRTFERVGGSESITSDARIVAATNRDLESMIARGEFREDLYYRLNVVSIKLPGLRERKEDIPLLVKHFIDSVCRDNNLEPLKITPQAMSVLERYSFPGNIRELRNLVERMVVLARTDTIDVEDIPEQVRNNTTLMPKAIAESPRTTEPEAIKLDLGNNERKLIEQALHTTKGNRTQAAEILGISRRTLLRRLKEYAVNGDPIKENN